MASRRRTNLGRHTTKARKMRLLRDVETEEHRKKRLEAQRKRVAAARAAETAEQTRQRREEMRRRRARYLATKREKMRSEKVKERVARLMENGSCEPINGELFLAVAATMGELGNNSSLRNRSSKRRKGSAASKRRAKLARQKGNNPSEERSITVDPEVFVKGVVKQWLNKVKTQVNVACSRVTIKTEVIDDDEPMEEPCPEAVPEAVVLKTEPSEGEAEAIEEESEVIIPDSLPSREELGPSVQSGDPERSDSEVDDDPIMFVAVKQDAEDSPTNDQPD